MEGHGSSPLCPSVPSGRLIPVAPDWNVFRLDCGISELGPLLARRLVSAGLCLDPTAPTLLLFDLPRGFALQELQVVDRLNARIIVLTDNPCTEYCDDLWDLMPAALLFPIRCDESLRDVMARVAQGERYRERPVRSIMTPAEHAVLRYLARGWENQRIAQYLGVAERSVRNTISRVYAKIEVSNRVQAALYYWGRSDLFR